MLISWYSQINAVTLNSIKYVTQNMERLNNPFVIYGYKGAEYFCDRQKVRV